MSEWNAGKVAVYVPATARWREWRLPGATPMPYAVYVDEADAVWLSDFGANAFVCFDPGTERFTRARLELLANVVRQILGRPGEVWGAESASTSSSSFGPASSGRLTAQLECVEDEVEAVHERGREVVADLRHVSGDDLSEMGEPSRQLAQLTLLGELCILLAASRRPPRSSALSNGRLRSWRAKP